MTEACQFNTGQGCYTHSIWEPGEGGKQIQIAGYANLCVVAYEALRATYEEQARAHENCIEEIHADQLATATRENELHDTKDRKLADQARVIAGAVARYENPAERHNQIGGGFERQGLAWAMYQDLKEAISPTPTEPKEV